MCMTDLEPGIKRRRERGLLHSMKQSTVSFLLTSHEFKLLASIVYLEPFLDEILSKVKAEDGGLRVKFPYEDLEDAVNALAHQVEHESDPERRQQLQALGEKLEGYKQLRQHVSVHGKVVVKKKIISKAVVCILEVRLSKHLPAGKEVLRTIAVSGNKNLYHLADVIVSSFDFMFDHCFAFYGDVNGQPNRTQKEIYELFVDIGEEPTAPYAQGVKKVKIATAFPEIGKTMLFRFDYGDDWRFAVELKESRQIMLGEKLPAVLKKTGKAPLQYPPLKDF